MFSWLHKQTDFKRTTQFHTVLLCLYVTDPAPKQSCQKIFDTSLHLLQLHAFFFYSTTLFMGTFYNHWMHLRAFSKTSWGKIIDCWESSLRHNVFCWLPARDTNPKRQYWTIWGWHSIINYVSPRNLHFLSLNCS